MLLLLLFFWRGKLQFHRITELSISAGVGIISDISNYLYILACSFAFVSLVTGVGTSQAIFVFLFATVITMLNPKLLKEDIHPKAMLVKLAALVLLIAGVILVVS